MARRERRSRTPWVALVLVLAFFAASLCGASSSARARGQVPDHILAAAWDEVEATAGSRFCSLYVRFLPDSTRVVRGKSGSTDYRLEFALEISELEISEPIIFVDLTNEGVLAPGSAVHGLPDCLVAAAECRMLISRSAARSLAAEHWQRVPSDEWDVSFHWDRADGYLWMVRTGWEQSNATSWTRYIAEIDVNTGEVDGDRWQNKTANPG